MINYTLETNTHTQPGHDYPVVILCGGHGRRLGTIGEKLPKTLLPVGGDPILKHIVRHLTQCGYRKYILPLGYRGDDIKHYVSKELELEYSNIGVEFILRDTGLTSNIASRLDQIKDLFDPREDFLLINGDTIFDSDPTELIKNNIEHNCWVTTSSGPVYSQWGIILEHRDGTYDFAHHRQFDQILLSSQGSETRGRINYGITALNSYLFTLLDFSRVADFETAIFRFAIDNKKFSNFSFDGFWHPVDTVKDLDYLNSRFEPKS